MIIVCECSYETKFVQPSDIMLHYVGQFDTTRVFPSHAKKS